MAQTRAYIQHTFANRIDTEHLQETLVTKGYHPGGVDGRFGISTMRAVVAFQNDHSLEPDGKVGPATWAVLDKKAAKPKATPKAEAPAEPPAEPEQPPVEQPPAAKKPAAKKAPAKKPAAAKG